MVPTAYLLACVWSTCVILHLSMAMSDDLMMMSMQPVMCQDSVNLGQVVMFCLNLPILLFVGYRYYKAAILGA